ncbi:MAG: 50S ribosome-binding GTPase, partial [Actinomycetota bacterium]|nr:50S ribosome-binding GTPase [Actinomycetota bacterium]
MSAFRRKSGNSASDLGARVAALRHAIDVGGTRLDEDAANRARRLAGKVGERLLLSGDRTVAALAGATGSGKSSLFNAISGAPLSTVGVRRPTTSTATAAIWTATAADSTADPSALLRWLAVPSWHLVPAADDSLDGLVLLDLPDHDSTETANRAESDRLVELVDVFIWVTDPQKYADAALHHGYLAPLAGHDAVTIVVLNQTDRLTPAQLSSCRNDLNRLLTADGLTEVEVIGTSVATGAGLADLRSRLAGAVKR